MSAIFTVVNTVLLRPLAYPDSDRLTIVNEIVPQYGRFSVAPATFLDWRQQNSVFERIAAFSPGSVTLINRAPHPNAAKVFINWFLSRQGQIAWQKHTDRNSLRIDISKEAITNWKERVPREDGHYIFTNLPEYEDLRPGRKIVEEALAEAKKK